MEAGNQNIEPNRRTSVAAGSNSLLGPLPARTRPPSARLQLARAASNFISALHINHTQLVSSLNFLLLFGPSDTCSAPSKVRRRLELELELER